MLEKFGKYGEGHNNIMIKDKIEHLIGRNVEIELRTDPEKYYRVGKAVPVLPKIRAKLLKRLKTWTWCYLAELTEPLFLDQEGITEKARKKYSTKFIKILPNILDSEKSEDGLYLRLVKQGKSLTDVIISYVEDPSDVPNELKTAERPSGKGVDPYFEKMPPIASGMIKLID